MEALATEDLTYKQKGHKTMAEFEIDSLRLLQLEQELQGGVHSNCQSHSKDNRHLATSSLQNTS